MADRQNGTMVAIETGGELADGCCGVIPGLQLSHTEAQQLAATFKALGHPVRLQIVELLSRYGGDVCVCDIESRFDLSQPTISHHLKILRQAGLIDCEKRGLWVHYFARSETLADLGLFFTGMV